MTSLSHLRINNYQNAILTEMGVSTWALAPSNKVDSAPDLDNAKEDSLSIPVVDKPIVSQESALAKLQQLKSKAVPLKDTDAVLTSFAQNDISSPLFNDVLLALGLTIDNVLHIESGQQNEYTGYPIFWEKGEQVSFEKKLLLTPNLDLLRVSPEQKKQLWRLLNASNS